MNICLKLNNFITIICWSNGEYIVLMLSGIGHLIIDDAIAINIFLLGMMTMTVKAAHQTWELMRIKLKTLATLLLNCSE